MKQDKEDRQKLENSKNSNNKKFQLSRYVHQSELVQKNVCLWHIIILWNFLPQNSLDQQNLVVYQHQYTTETHAIGLRKFP